MINTPYNYIVITPTIEDYENLLQYLSKNKLISESSIEVFYENKENFTTRYKEDLCICLDKYNKNTKTYTIGYCSGEYFRNSYQYDQYNQYNWIEVEPEEPKEPKKPKEPFIKTITMRDIYTKTGPNT